MKLVQLIRSRLHYKMIIIYSLLTLAPLIVVSATFYFNSKRIVEHNEDQSFKQTFSETSDKIDGVLKAFAGQASDIGDNRLVYTLLRNAASPDKYPLMSSEHSTLEEGVSEMLQIEFDDMKRGIGDYANAIYLFDAEGKHYSAGSNPDVQYKEALNIMPFEKQGVPEWAFFVDHRRMVCNMQVIDPVTGTHLGLLVVMLDTAKVRELYGTYPQDSFFITNASNVVMSADDPESIGQMLAKAEKSKTITTESQSKGTSFKYVSRIPISDASKGIRKLAWFSIAITLVSWISVMVITYYVLRRITSPLTTLSRLMRDAQKENYQLIENFGSHDEIAMLCNSFNKMIMETRDLIQKAYKAELIQKEAQLAAIRAYFNPHFLHNTLEYISILAKSKEKIDLIPTLVKNLSSIFRFSIAPGEAFVSLDVEMKFAQIYLQIHQYRFEDRFEYKLDIPDHLKQISVPKLILQPVIENAFKHGIDHIRQKGRIEIRAYESKFDLVIEIEDNGRSAAEGTAKTKGMGSGLNSIESRIKLHYGERYGLERLQGAQGMLIRLHLPILLHDPEDNPPREESDNL